VTANPDEAVAVGEIAKVAGTPVVNCLEPVVCGLNVMLWLPMFTVQTSVAAGPVPPAFVALRSVLNVPAVVGVPDNTPAALSKMPPGRGVAE
jgi:hypothetical protein